MNTDRFKFRVWVNEDIERTDCACLKKEWLDVQCRWFSLSNNDEEIQWGIEEPEEPLTIGVDCLVEFCTGLKDCNGKLIFEGDIVELSGRKITVEFRNGGFGWSLKENNGEEYDWISFSGHGYLKEVLGRITVIGNIHSESK